MSDDKEIKSESESNSTLNKVEEALIRKNPELFQNIPKAQREEMVRAVISITRIHNGPLPPLELIEGYEEVYPGSAKIIFDVFEKQSNHRMKMEDTVITAQQTQSGRGQHYALIIAVLFLAAATVCILQNHDVAGGTLGTIDVLGIVTIFISGKAKQSTNLREKEPNAIKKPSPLNDNTNRAETSNKKKK